MQNVLSKLISPIFGLVLALLLVEVLVRLFIPHPRYEEAIYPNLQVGYTLRPNFQGRVTNMFGEFDTMLKTNREGFRDSDRPLQKTPGTTRIAFLGDSFTCAEQVEENETFVRQVEKSLNSEHYPVECLNFGISGYDTQQEVLCYESFVRKYHPDLVVLESYPRNDMIGNIFYEIQHDFGRPYYRLEEDSLVKVEADPIKLQKSYKSTRHNRSVQWYQHLQSYNAYKHLRWEILTRWNRYEMAKNPPTGRDLWKQPWYDGFHYYLLKPDSITRKCEKISKLLLERLDREVSQDGGRLLIVICPAYSSLWPDRWSERVKFFPGLEKEELDLTKGFKQIPSFLPELASQGRILDLRESLRKTDRSRSIFFARDNHYNAWGHEAIAQAITSWIKPHLVKSNP